ncbi:response regulator [Leadbetterella sp. DM7]|uniref:response regulator n=1 Tax=Leadbetterella sp. DM7 TaxID=3235085 RepID=UPI00349EB260
MKKILIADDHTMFINGLRLLLSAMPGFEVNGVASDGQQALEHLARHKTDIILMDVNMPVLNGYQTTFQVREQHPGVKIIVLSMLADEHSVTKMLEAGAHGYLFKNADEEELLEALETVLEGKIYITREIRDKICLSKRNAPANEEITRLSSREMDIARLIMEGYTNTEISDKLFISVRTAETHRKNILAKFNLKNTASLVKYLMDNKPFLGL